MENYRSHKPVIIAHRGHRTQYPENTMVSFKAAIKAGIKMVELDATLTKDRKVVVIHDDTLDRTTNGKGPVKDNTLAQLKKLDAGRWFDLKFSNETIPTLDEVISSINGNAKINIEVKYEVFEPHGPFDAVEKQVVEIVRAHNVSDSVIISSFEWKALENIRAMDETIKLALLTDRPLADADLAWCRRINAYSWHPDYITLSQNQVKKVQNIGVKVIPYTVNLEKDILAVLNMGVDGIITDNIEMVLNIIED